MSIKNYLSLTFVSALLVFSFFPLEKAQADPSPQKVTASSGVVFLLEDSGGAVYTLDFWNVGALDQSGEYSEVVATLKCAPNNNAEGCSDEMPSARGTFSGGPNGTFLINDIEFSLIDGERTTAYDAGESVVFKVDNPEAFEGNWLSEDKKREAEVPFPTTSDLRGGVVRGDVQISRTKGSTYLDIGTNSVTIKTYDVIKTGQNSRFIIKYKDGSYFRVKSNSIVTILPNGVQLQVGDSWFNLQKQGKEFKVVTPTTVCGVLGTTFSVSHSIVSGKSTVDLLEGSVELEVPDEDEMLVLVAGERAVVSDEDSIKEQFDSEVVLEEESKVLNEELAMIDFDNPHDIDEAEKDLSDETNLTHSGEGESSMAAESNNNLLLAVLGAVVVVIGVWVIVKKRQK